MADIECRYLDREHELEFFDDVIATYNWIADALKYVFKNKSDIDINCAVSFKSGELSYDCHSIDEFKKYAFGKEIKVGHITIWASESLNGILISVYSSNRVKMGQQEFILTSENEQWLVDLRDALQNRHKLYAAHPAATVVKYEDNSIHIGDGNSITGSSIGAYDTVEIENKTGSAKKEKGTLLSKVFWQFIIPIAAAVMAVAICIWLGLSK